MKAEARKLMDIFSGQRKYIIPVFQRGYAWEEDRWISLWEDIFNLANETGSNLHHFIGPLVIIPFNDSFSEVQRFTVIDGQQRLITLTLLLAVVRNRASHLGYNELAEAITSNQLMYTDSKGQKEIRIIPRTKDRNILENIVKEGHEKDDGGLIFQAYNFFLEKLLNETPEQLELGARNNKQVLEVIFKTIIQRLQVVTIEIDHSDNPSNVFESLNFKQEKLADADLIRNYVFMNLPNTDNPEDFLPKQESFDSSYWRDFETMFSDPQINLTDFYYRFLLFKTSYSAKSMLYVHFTQFIDQFYKLKNTELVQELRNYAELYIKFKIGGFKDLEIDNAISRIRELQYETVIPLIFAFFCKYNEEEISKPQFIKLLRIVESFLLRRSLAKYRTRGYGEDFVGAKDVILKNKNPDNILLQLKTFFFDKGLPTNDEIKNAIETVPLYKQNDRVTRFILKAIEMSFEKKESVDMNDSSVISIEHIMPQNLTEEWRTYLDEKADFIHEKYLHTLGNLTLTGYNSELARLPFLKKKAILLDSKIEINKYFSNVNEWKEKNIIERANDISQRFFDLWEGPPKQNRTSQEDESSIKKTKKTRQELLF